MNWRTALATLIATVVAASAMRRREPTEPPPSAPPDDEPRRPTGDTKAAAILRGVATGLERRRPERIQPASPAPPGERVAQPPHTRSMDVRTRQISPARGEWERAGLAGIPRGGWEKMADRHPDHRPWPAVPDEHAHPFTRTVRGETPIGVEQEARRLAFEEPPRAEPSHRRRGTPGTPPPVPVSRAGEIRRARRDPQRRGLVYTSAVFIAVAVVAIFVLLPTWDLPWQVESREWGNRAIAMNTFASTRQGENPLIVPPDVLPPVPDAGVTAAEAYENVTVLGDLDKAQFDRLMEAITLWVAPDKGCGFCHEGDNYAAPGPYQNQVAERMLRMVRDMNANWEHVRPSGVSCYNCHRGNNVPLYKWAKAEHEPAPGAILGDPDPWNAQEQTIREFFPQEPYERYLLEGEQIRGLQARQAITSDERMSLHDGEQVYLLMMQMADALNVNCTYCHNSRAFYDWRQGTPMHTAGYYGIEMTVHLNQTYFRDLHEIVPPEREGPLGDAYKPNCMTCHVTQPRPFDGMSWVDQYPGLVGQPAEDPPADASSPVVTVPLAEGGWAPQEPLASPDVGWAPQPSTPDPRP